MSCQDLNKIPDYIITVRRPSVNIRKILESEVNIVKTRFDNSVTTKNIILPMENQFVSESIENRILLIEALSFMPITITSGDEKYFVIDNYYDLRYEKRKTSSITWPEKLSKKETVLCKIEMIKTMLGLVEISVTAESNDQNTIKKIRQLLREVKKIESNVYAKSSTPTEGSLYYRYPGLPKEDAEFLNLIYKTIIKTYQKKS